MLHYRSVVEIADNSGVVEVRLFAVNGKNNRRAITVGDSAMGSAIKVSPTSKILKGDKVKILVIATKRKIKRKDGTVISCSKNLAIVVNKQTGEMAGTRIFGPVFREIRDTGDVNKKVISLAPEVL